MKTQKNIRLLFTLALVCQGIALLLELLLQLFQKPFFTTEGYEHTEHILLPSFLCTLFLTALFAVLFVTQWKRMRQNRRNSIHLVLTIIFPVLAAFLRRYAFNYEIYSYSPWQAQMGLDTLGGIQYFSLAGFVCLVAGSAMLYSYSSRETGDTPPNPAESVPPQEMQ